MIAPQPKPSSRLKKRLARQREDRRLQRQFLAAVWDRDKGRCRCCGVRCLKRLDLHPRRGEVHHLEGRDRRPLRFQARCAILLCASCHEAITHHQMRVAPSRLFVLDGETLIDGDAPLTFPAVL